MLGKSITLSAITALAALTMAPAAQARPWGGDGYSQGGYFQQVLGDRYYGRGGGDRGYRGGDRYYGRGGGGYYGNRGYRGGGYYADRGYGGRGYYGGRGRCRDNGTGGTIIGAIAGGLLGNEVGQGRYNRGDGTTGAILGAGVGALAGRAIDRNC